MLAASISARHAPPDRPRHAARVARSPGDRYRYAFLAHGRYPPLARHNFRMAPTHGGCAPSYITDDHHRRLLSGDHLHHGLLRAATALVADMRWASALGRRD